MKRFLFVIISAAVVMIASWYTAYFAGFDVFDVIEELLSVSDVSWALTHGTELYPLFRTDVIRVTLFSSFFAGLGAFGGVLLTRRK